jgi:hypothetical protein
MNKLCSYNSSSSSIEIESNSNSSNNNDNNNSSNNNNNNNNNNSSSSSRLTISVNGATTSASPAAAEETRPWKIAAQQSSELSPPSNSSDYFYLPFALGCLSIGSLIGGYLTMRKKGTKFNSKKMGQPVMMAFKALTVATAFTCGAFGLATVAFIQYTDVRSFAELNEWGKFQFNKFEAIVENRNKHKVDPQTLSEAGAKDEEEYLNKIFDKLMKEEPKSKEKE